MPEERKDEIYRLVAEAARDKRLTCAQAHTLADKHGIELAEIGRAADALGIKITKCQLGCF